MASMGVWGAGDGRGAVVVGHAATVLRVQLLRYTSHTRVAQVSDTRRTRELLK